MNHIETIKEFILRKQELLNTIKPIVFILVLDETKRELIEANNEKRTYQYEKNDIIHEGEDIYQQNAIDLVNTFYEFNINKTNDRIESLSSTVERLKMKLNFNNDFPINKEKLAYERRVEIEWIFNIILTKDKLFQSQCFEILKNLIFGELIRNNKPTLLQEMERLCLTIKHLIDLRISLNQFSESKNEELFGFIDQLKKDFIYSGGDVLKFNKNLEGKNSSLNGILSWYGITNEERAHIKIESVISQRIVSSKNFINNLNNENKLYVNMISNFEANVEKWKQNWINIELPNEDFF